MNIYTYVYLEATTPGSSTPQHYIYIYTHTDRYLDVTTPEAQQLETLIYIYTHTQNSKQ